MAPKSEQIAQLVGSFANFARRYGFELVISPMFEDVGVYNRGIGETSEVARKEMYVFEDRGGRSLALRPEGTASIVRAFIQHRPTTPWKAWYVTPAFRYERHQAGRYRQHHQVGVEVLGSDDPTLDVEVISLAWRFYESLGLAHVTLMINSMGDEACRPQYLVALSEHLAAHERDLCDEHAVSWRTNALRVLDCKKESCISVTSNGPMLRDHLCNPCREHFSSVTAGLDALEIDYSTSDRLVRGFDYYTRTTFEFASDAMNSAQNAIGGGGRYDRLTEQLGGPSTPGIGFGSGLERILIALEAEDIVLDVGSLCEVFVVDTTGGAQAMVLCDELRAGGLAVERSYDQRSMKSQMKQADRSGALVAVLVGPQELDNGTVTLRDLRSDSDQRQRVVERSAIAAAIHTLRNEMT